jgi:hypothetical protein
MLEIHTANSMLKNPSCFTFLTLETYYYKAIKVYKNVESNSVGVKSLSGSCDIQVEDKVESVWKLSVQRKYHLKMAMVMIIFCMLFL